MHQRYNNENGIMCVLSDLSYRSLTRSAKIITMKGMVSKNICFLKILAIRNDLVFSKVGRFSLTDQRPNNVSHVIKLSL